MVMSSSENAEIQAGPPLPDHFLWLSLPAICHRHDQDDAITTFDQRGMPPASAAYSGAAASLIQF
jgi:hypothetical protein